MILIFFCINREKFLHRYYEKSFQKLLLSFDTFQLNKSYTEEDKQNKLICVVVILNDILGIKTILKVCHLVKIYDNIFLNECLETCCRG